MTKIKMSDEEFIDLYFNNKAPEIACFLQVSEGCVYAKALKLGLRKNRGKTSQEIIPGGLPQKEV